MDTITCYIAVLTVYFFVRLFGCLIQHLMGDVEFAETLQDKAEAEEGEWLILTPAGYPPACWGEESGLPVGGIRVAAGKKP